MTQKHIGALVMAYGSPSSINELGPYYTHIRNGSAPSAALLEELRSRYLGIGGVSPLNAITQAQAALLEERLNQRFVDRAFKVFVGFKHVAPFIEDAVDAMRAEGIEQAAVIAMSPYVSDYGPTPYLQRVRATAAHAPGLRLFEVRDWWREPGFGAYWSAVVRHELAALAEPERRQAVVIFSAHSLPLDWHAARNYARCVEESARLMANAAGAERWAFAWQSAGRRGGAWLGPDIAAVTRELRGTGAETFIYCPIGFTTDHLEVLHDIDHECRDLVAQLGGRFVRAPMPNTGAAFIACLADAVEGALPEELLAERQPQS